MLVKINIESDSNALEPVDGAYLYELPAKDTNGVDWTVRFESTDLGITLDVILYYIAEDSELNNAESIDKILREREAEELEGYFKNDNDILEYIQKQFESGNCNELVILHTPYDVLIDRYDEIDYKIVDFDVFSYTLIIKINDEDYPYEVENEVVISYFNQYNSNFDNIKEALIAANIYNPERYSQVFNSEEYKNIIKKTIIRKCDRESNYYLWLDDNNNIVCYTDFPECSKKIPLIGEVEYADWKIGTKEQWEQRGMWG